jgi:hypothetical protein
MDTLSSLSLAHSSERQEERDGAVELCVSPPLLDMTPPYPLPNLRLIHGPPTTSLRQTSQPNRNPPESRVSIVP